MRTFQLNGKWKLKYRPQDDICIKDWNEVDAEVPGNVELDLIKYNKLKDLVKDSNVYSAIELELYEWLYIKDFIPPNDLRSNNLDFVFDGIDCIADIYLNGQKIGSTANMFISHRFNVSSLLKRGEQNRLEINIKSAVIEGRKYKPTPSESAANNNWESLRIRKAAHMYGWDIAPRIVSAGLWRGVRLETIPQSYFDNIYWSTLKVNVKEKTAQLMLAWSVKIDNSLIYDSEIQIKLKYQGKTVFNHSRALTGHCGREFAELDDVNFWWPRGAGNANLYEAEAKIVTIDGRIIAESSQTIGIRTVELKRTEITSDKRDGDFSFWVNGKKIFMKGTNWVPLDALHSRDSMHLRKTFDMVLDLNCNMLRCWGGNVYEDHEFFELCDQNGILVWQDFAFACAAYPQDEDFLNEARKEADFIVKKLRNHPSLALWAGNNEIDCVYAEWYPIKQDPNLLDKISRKVLKESVNTLDPTRDYLPSSPYYGSELISRDTPHNMKPEDHLWGPRDDFKSEFYMSSNAHFVSEIGYHGCPCLETMQEMFSSANLWPWQNNEHWLTKAVRPLPGQTDYNFRIPLVASQIEVLFNNVPDEIEDFILASQISQAEALKFFIEKWRSEKWKRSGILWWNLKDCWPIISDAIVDYYYRKKLAYDYIKTSQNDLCAIVTEPEDGFHKAILVNDSLEHFSGKIEISDLETGNNLLNKKFTITADDKICLGKISTADKPEFWILKTSLTDGKIIKNHYLAGPRPFSLKQYKMWLKSYHQENHAQKELLHRA